MKTLFLALICSVGILSWAQTDVTLNIQHKLGTEPFALDAAVENNLGNPFQATRLEYYISQFSLVHDGGTVTDVPLEVLALVNPGDEATTSISLGNFDVTSVESIQFYIGVYEPENNADPTLWPEDHPLAPKSPSMHWGWAAGYRFLAYEGLSGEGFSQTFQLHGLGNDNYFRTYCDVTPEMVDGVLELNITADYLEALRDIELSGGVISHGETGAALKALENFRDFVFGTQVASITSLDDQATFRAFPNPADRNQQVTVQFESNQQVSRIEVMNNLGQRVLNELVNGTTMTFKIPDAGVYFVQVYSEEGLLSRKKLVIQ